MLDRQQLSRDIVTYLTETPRHTKAVLRASGTFWVGAYVVTHVGLGAVLLIAGIGKLVGHYTIGSVVGVGVFLLGAPLTFTYTLERRYRDIAETAFETRLWTDKPWTFISATLLGGVAYVPWVLLPMSSYGGPLATASALFTVLTINFGAKMIAIALPLIATPAVIVIALPFETRFIPSFLDPRSSHQRRSDQQTTQSEQSHQDTGTSTPASNRAGDQERTNGHQQTHSTDRLDGSQRSPNQRDQSRKTGGREFDWQFGSTSRVTFADVGGFTSQKKELSDKVLKPLVGNAQQYEKLDLTPSNVILYGPPGTGKSHLANAAMGQTDLPTLSVSGGNLLSRWVNASAEQIARLFEEAHQLSREHGGAIVFIDEIDSVLPTRGGANQHREDDKVVNEFLRYLELSTAEMYDDSSIPSTTDVVVIGATNHFRELDDAATRSGRIDLKLEIGMPDQTQRRAVLAAQLSQRQHSVREATLDRVAAATDGYSAADIGAAVDEAAYNAAANGREMITETDLRHALTTRD